MPDVYAQTLTKKPVKTYAATDLATVEKDGFMSKEHVEQLEHLVADSGVDKLPLNGGTMSGNIAMDGYKITGLPEPEYESDPVTIKYLNDYMYTTPIANATTTNLTPDIYWTFGEVNSLDINLVDVNDNKVHEYLFEFIPSASFSGLTINPSVSWVNEPMIQVGKTCQVSILRGVGVMISA